MDIEAQIDAVQAAMISKVMDTGYFTFVNEHEPTSDPGNQDMFAAVWLQLLRPIAARSGLDITSGMLVYNCRMYKSQMSEPQDFIDPQMIRATAKLMADYSGDFTLGGLISSVDLLGAHDIPLSAVAGYLTLQNRKYRVMTLTIPMILNDLFTQAP